MRWVVEYDRAAAVDFVRLVGHPEPAAVDCLHDAAVLKVEYGGRTAGYFWFVWVGPTTMALYACVASRYRGRWTRHDLGELHKFPAFLGARRLIARTTRRSSGSGTAPGGRRFASAAGDA